MKRLVRAAFLSSFVLAGCTSNSFVSVQSPEAEWVLQTPDLSAVFWEDQGSGELTVNNQTNEPLGTPSLLWYNTTTQELELIPVPEAVTIPAKGSVTKQISFPWAIQPSSYVQLQVDNQAVGGFYAASSFSGLYPAWTFATSPATERPTSGTWSFDLSGSGDNLVGTCAGVSGGFSSYGEVALEVATDGLTARMNAEGNNILFNRVTLDKPDYHSLENTFPLEHQGNTVIGSVEYEFTASAPDHITGTIVWDNSVDCVWRYPFSLELIAPAVWELFIPQAGFWTITYGTPQPCQGMEVNLGLLSGVPLGAGELTLNGGGAAPLQILLDTPNGDLNLMQSGGGNSYVSTIPNQFLGTQFDPVTQATVVFSGTVQTWGLSQTSMFGHLMMQGSNGCGLSVPFTLTHV